MKTIYKVICIVCIFAISCDDFLDVNEDPNVPRSDEVTEAIYLPGLLGYWAYIGVAQITQEVIPLDLQLASERVIAGTRNHNINSGNSWPYWNLFTSLLNHSLYLKDLASKNENPHYQGIAEVITAWTFATLTDFFDNIPVSEAIQFPRVIHPRFETQEQAYTRVFELLESAIINFETEVAQQNRRVRGDDLVYAGDIDKWKRLAYSLKARYNMRLTYAPGRTIAGQADVVISSLANGMQSSSDDALFRHYVGTGYQSGLYEYSITSAPFAFTPTLFIVDTMAALNDPRLPVYFTKDSENGYSGWISGVVPVSGGFVPSRVRNSYIGPKYPEIFMNYIECQFLLAEAYALKEQWSMAESAFRNGISTNMESLGINQADSEGYLNQFTFPQNTEGAQALIMLQKNLSNYITNFEVHFDFLRTGYPLTDFQANFHDRPYNYDIVRRMPYPDSEKLRNPNCPDNTYNIFTTKVWWDNK